MSYVTTERRGQAQLNIQGWLIYVDVISAFIKLLTVMENQTAFYAKIIYLSMTFRMQLHFRYNRVFD